MNTVFIVLGIIALIALGILFWVMGNYNGLVTKKSMVDEAWSGIDVQLKRRYDLIPNLVSVVKQYSFHEKTVLEQITAFRSKSMGAQGINEKVSAEKGLTQALHNLFVVVENYPDLKANQNYLHLQSELASIENELQLARRYYNGAVREYSIAITIFPTNIVAKATGFNAVPYFELSNEQERENPGVHF